MIEQVPPPQLAAWLQDAASESGQRPLLLDVREPLEWQAASIHPPGAELLQLPLQTLPARLHSLDPGRPVAVLCHHGGRSMQAAAFLIRQGFDRVANITGGIDAWAALDPRLPRY